MQQQQFHRRLPVRRAGERGSALLIVFVLAAVIAIMLYREMPVAAFEARRQKEQTLVDRGHEYQRAVQLYYRKFSGRYPADVKMLENTNSMRFLRKHYVDPFTGKDDWRLLHAGPGGMLIDSKVQNFNASGVLGQNNINANGSMPLGQGLSGSTGINTSSATAGTQNANSISNPNGDSSFGSSSSSDPGLAVPPVAKRGPVVAANSQSETPSTADLNADPSTPLLPQTEDSSTASSATPPPAATTPGVNQQAGQSTRGTAPGQTGTSAFGNNNGTPQGLGAMTGNTLGGSFAGVASKAQGKTIKKINDQTDYSKWEFWYDPSKDTSMGNNGNMQNGAGGQNIQPGSQLGQPANSTFGNTGSSTFGNNGNTSNPFGSQATPTQNVPATATPVPDNSGAAPQPGVPQ